MFRLFKRYVDNVDIVQVQTIEEALRAVTVLPARALIVNTSMFENPETALQQLAASEMPYETPILTCRVHDEVETAERLGVAQYLVKPVTREPLLASLESLGAAIKNVLLVDDSQEVLRLFSRILTVAPQRYRVFRATNGQRALALMRQRQPNAVVLDLIMAGMDGFQVLTEMKRDPAIRNIPVIVVSSQDPTGGPITSDVFSVKRTDGLSARELVTMIQSVSDILASREPLTVQPVQ